MSTRMLIDARHPEETRVVVQRGNKVEDFDFESAAKRQLKGNIYLAKVTRVEPSLQAAFVDYGGNRHGFLAFSEIHPDYYQIPVEDREALLREEAEELAAAEEEPSAERQAAGEAEPAANEDDNGEGNGGEPEAAETVADGGGHEEEEALRRNRRNLRRRYKIQEVIKRRQILLVQVVKEERGNKGAALTTYLSLAGRYCVLMPNSTHGGGISRKISTVKDRRRLRTIMADLAIPEGMGCIIRTAGLERTKAEIKRDFDYLLRLWDGIRELTLQSAAPCLTYEEGDLIKRSIRDLYNKDIDEILVEGDEGYKAAKSFMRLLMPSHAKKVKQYKDRTPLFHRYKVEAALETMYSPVVQLKSGGYIVLNATEALVAIDVNSGRSTREHNIEETALSTNLEAAAEVARQLRMRDLAGLIVIDFIDMEDRQNIRAVERRLRDALKVDRARVQVGRISSFGLLEMSRQRLHPGLLEASTHVCPTCKGSGAVRSVHSSALHALRALEDEALKGRASHIAITLQTDVALYLLNQKRDSLRDLEQLYNIRIEVAADPSVIAPEYLIEHSGPPPQAAAPGAEAVTLGAPPAAEPEAEAEDEDEEAQAEETAGAA
ncbi:MAG: Rne/Rng family ribonuclease, partial [Pseudomonadota bacterium]